MITFYKCMKCKVHKIIKLMEKCSTNWDNETLTESNNIFYSYK